MTTNASGLAAAKASEDGGLDVIQFDEPTFTVFHDEVQDWGVAALERAAESQHTA